MKAKDRFFLKALAITVVAVFMVSLGYSEVYGSSETELLFDDFLGTSVNTDLWDILLNSSGASVTVNNSILTINTGTTNGGGGAITSKQQFTVNENTLVLEMRVKVEPPVNAGANWNLFSAACPYGFGFGFNPLPPNNLEVGGGENGVFVELPHIDGTIWHTYRIEHGEDAVDFYVDDVLEATITEGVTTACPMVARLTRGTAPDMAFNRTISVDFARVTTIPNPIAVSIDIKPGSDPNCFNNNGQGVIPVAILSSVDFDATQVDPTTVSLDGQAIRVVGKKGNLQSHIEDSNGDGLDDLIVQIEDEDGTYEEGDTIATLTGETFDGTPIQGTDTLCIVP